MLRKLVDLVSLIYSIRMEIDTPLYCIICSAGSQTDNFSEGSDNNLNTSEIAVHSMIFLSKAICTQTVQVANL